MPYEIESVRKENLWLSREALAIVGENGRRRFDEFKKYKSGWYGGKGKELSKWSVTNFELFIREITELKLARPSLFMTLAGNLSLQWEDKNGFVIEIEYHPDKIEYYIESLQEEGSVGLAGTFDFTAEIRKLLS